MPKTKEQKKRKSNVEESGMIKKARVEQALSTEPAEVSREVEEAKISCDVTEAKASLRRKYFEKLRKLEEAGQVSTSSDSECDPGCAPAKRRRTDASFEPSRVVEDEPSHL